MTLKYDKFKFIGLLLLKKPQKVSIERDRFFPLKFWTKNRLFLRPQMSLKSKTNTNQERIGCLFYHEIKSTVPLNTLSDKLDWREYNHEIIDLQR